MPFPTRCLKSRTHNRSKIYNVHLHVFRSSDAPIMAFWEYITYLLTYILTYLLNNLLTYLITYLIIYLLTNLRTYLLTYRVLLEKLTGLQLVKKFPAFHGTRTFITALKSFRHLSLSCASPIQSIYPHSTSWRSILILTTLLLLGLPNGLPPSSFPSKTLYTPHSSPIRATCPAHLISGSIYYAVYTHFRHL